VHTGFPGDPAADARSSHDRVRRADLASKRTTSLFLPTKRHPPCGGHDEPPRGISPSFVRCRLRSPTYRAKESCSRRWLTDWFSVTVPEWTPRTATRFA
jgi:hypothetical protein